MLPVGTVTAALRVWQALLAAGQALEVTPYGLDALNTLRIEKGHVTGAELNGNTGAHDLGFERLLKKQGDFIGRAALDKAKAAGLKRTLVGLEMIDRGIARGGVHVARELELQSNVALSERARRRHLRNRGDAAELPLERRRYR